MCVDAGGSGVKRGEHSHKKEVPMIVVCVDEVGRLDEPHEEGLQTRVVLLESWAADIGLRSNKANTHTHTRKFSTLSIHVANADVPQFHP